MFSMLYGLKPNIQSVLQQVASFFFFKQAFVTYCSTIIYNPFYFTVAGSQQMITDESALDILSIPASNSYKAIMQRHRDKLA